MKLFKNISTDELYVQNDDSDKLFDFKGNEVHLSSQDVCEIYTGPRPKSLSRLHIVDEEYDIESGWPHTWHLKDVLYVPVHTDYGLYPSTRISFSVEHISNNRIYFVSTEALGMCSMDDVDEFLYNYQCKLPESLLNEMCDIEHQPNDKESCSRKLSLLSLTNVHGKDSSQELKIGRDDIAFTGMSCEYYRCKGNDGDSQWYWLRTQRENINSSDSKYFYAVSSSGAISNSNSANTLGVVLFFVIDRKVDELNVHHRPQLMC